MLSHKDNSSPTCPKGFLSHTVKSVNKGQVLSFHLVASVYKFDYYGKVNLKKYEKLPPSTYKHNFFKLFCCTIAYHLVVWKEPTSYINIKPNASVIAFVSISLEINTCINLDHHGFNCFLYLETCILCFRNTCNFQILYSYTNDRKKKHSEMVWEEWCF